MQTFEPLRYLRCDRSRIFRPQVSAVRVDRLPELEQISCYEMRLHAEVSAGLHYLFGLSTQLAPVHQGIGTGVCAGLYDGATDAL